MEPTNVEQRFWKELNWLKKKSKEDVIYKCPYEDFEKFAKRIDVLARSRRQQIDTIKAFTEGYLVGQRVGELSRGEQFLRDRADPRGGR